MQATTWSWWTCTATQNTKQRAQGSVYTSQPDIYRPISLWHGLKAVCTHRNQTFTDLSHCGMGSRQCVHIATRHLQTYLTVAWAQGSVYTSQPDIYRPISLWHGLKAVCTHRNQTLTDLSHCGMGSRQCVHIATRHLQTYLTVAWAQGSVYTSQPDIYRPISLWHGLKAVFTHRNQTFTDLSHCGMGSRQCVHIATRHLQTYLTVACKWFYKKTHWFHWLMQVILQENPLISLIDESDFTRKPIDFTDHMWWKWFYKKTLWFHWLMKVILQENPLISLITCDENDFTRKPIDFTDHMW